MQLKFVVVTIGVILGCSATLHGATFKELLADASVAKAKILTEEAGIVRVSAGSLIASHEGFANAPIHNIHLFTRGQQQRITIISQNNVFDANDTLVFVAERRSGEGQYYDIEGRFRAYFVLVDASTPALAYETPPTVDAGNSVYRYMQQDVHVEEDNEYFLGFTLGDSHPTSIHRTEVVAGEGWYWKQFLQLGRSVSTSFTWYGKPGESVDVSYGYATLSDAPVFNPDHYVAPIFNGDTLSKIESNGYAIEHKSYSIPSHAIVQGINTASFASLGVPISKDNPLYTDVTAFDYLQVAGESLAILVDGRLNGNVALQTSSGTIQVLADNERLDVVNVESGTYMQSLSAQPAVLYSWQYDRSMPNVVTVDGTTIEAAQANTSVFVMHGQQGWQQVTASELLNINQAEEYNVVGILDQSASVQEIQALASIGVSDLQSNTSYLFAVRKSATKGVVVESLHSVQTENERGSGFMPGPGSLFVHELGTSHDGIQRIVAASTQGHVPFQVVETSDIPTDILNPKQCDAVIITHARFREQAERLAEYRRERDGFSVQVFDVETLYNWYNFGEKKPHAIKEFLSEAYNDWPGPPLEYVVLVGDASWDPRQVAPDSYKEDLVPSFGKPVSDFWYTLLDGDNIEPEVAIGRITVETAEQAEHYIDKVIEYESMALQPWMKEYLLLAGGSDAGEFSNEQKLLADFARELQATRIESAPFCANADTLFKQTVDAVTTEHALLIRELINQGKLWVSYMGHSAPTIFDMDFGTAEQLNNDRKYPFLATYSCQTGAFAEPNVTAKNEDYVRIDNKGFIGAYGTTGFGEAYVENNMRTYMFDSLRFGNRLRRLGDILIASKMSILSDEQKWTNNPYSELPATYYNVIMQQSLLGDPMLELRLPRGPELLIDESEIRVVGPTNELPQEGDSIVYVRVPVRNAGMQYSSAVTISIAHTYFEYTYSTQVTLSSLCGTSFVEFVIPVEDQIGAHSLAISIEGEKGIEEETLENNHVTVLFDVATDGVLPLDPLDYWNVSSSNPVFRVANPRETSKLDITFAIEDASQTTVATSVIAQVEVHELYTDWQYIGELSKGTYTLSVIAAQTDGIGKSRELRIPFYVDGLAIDSTVVASWRQHLWQQVAMENLSVNTSANVVLQDKPYTIEVMSNAWFPTRWTSVKIDETGYSFTGIFDRGFNLFQFRYVHADSTWITRRRFDTWEPGNARAMIDYLQDSVQTNDLIVMNTHGSAWRGVRLDNLEDEVRTVFEQYGISFADSITDNTAFAMSATPSTLFFADYLQNSEDVQDTLVVRGKALLPISRGTMRTPKIGPSRNWRSVSVPGIQGAEVDIVVYGASSPEAQEEEIGVLHAKDFTLDFIDPLTHPFVSLELRVSKSEVGGIVEIPNVDVLFEPTAEYGIDRNKSSMPQETVLQGEDVYANLHVVNMSRRTSGSGLVVRSRVTDVEDQSNVKISRQTVTYVPALGPSFELASSIWLPTLGTGSTNVVDVVVEETPFRELYTYNNEARGVLNTDSDRVAPRARLFANGFEVASGDNVPQVNTLLLQIRDNSRQLWNDPQSILIEINGRTIVPDELEFGQIRDTAEPRISALFASQTFDIGLNRVDVTATDRSGNTNQQTWLLNVDRQAELLSLPGYPNPFDQEITFVFDVKDNLLPFSGVVSIYNVHGRKVRELTFDPRIGQNEVLWDGLSQQGTSLASGTYLAMVEILGGSDVLRTSLGPVLKR